uniref:Tim44-like domain-containing protein n=1 Tax=Panagrolaimus sp. JU765 TaxID=591449 RepID=A0AC34R0C6_9BILA
MIRILSPRCFLKQTCSNLSTVHVAGKNEVPLQNSVKQFYLFPAPMVTTPSFELWRSIGNTVAKVAYSRYEPQYTDKGFINGSKQAISLIAKAIREQNNELISSLSLKRLSYALFDRLKDFPPEFLQTRFSFDENNIIHGFFHSCIMSNDRSFSLDISEMAFFGTVVAIIDPNSTKPVPISEALKDVNSQTLFCNITVCRRINPLGPWKISHINFFDDASRKSLQS